MCALLMPLLLAAAPPPAREPVVQPVPAAPLSVAAPPAAASSEPPAADLLAFADMDTRMTVPVRIAGSGPSRFVIDTGAERTVISRELASSLGLAKGHDVHLIAMAGTSTEPTVVIPSISVSTLGGAGIEAPALAGPDLGAPGMLGIDALQGHAVSIDFPSQTMTVIPSTRRLRQERTLPGEIVVRARNLFGQLIVTDAWCDGERIKVVLNTGSAVSMGNLALQRRFARRQRGGVNPILLTAVTGRTLNADYTTIDRIKIGDLTISKLPIAYADAPPFRRFGLGDSPAILLGMDALRLFRRVRIDFANREVRLAPPPDRLQTGRGDGWTALPVG